jgi:hypothetical protein
MVDKKPQKLSDFRKNPSLGEVERMAIAASRKMKFEEAGVKDTPQNRKDWAALVKDFDEMERDGITAEIPFT